VIVGIARELQFHEIVFRKGAGDCHCGATAAFACTCALDQVRCEKCAVDHAAQSAVARIAALKSQETTNA